MHVAMHRMLARGTDVVKIQRGNRRAKRALSEKDGGGDAESFAEFFDVMFVELAFAAEDLGDDAF
jgi:hypothetical protein